MRCRGFLDLRSARTSYQVRSDAHAGRSVLRLAAGFFTKDLPEPAPDGGGEIRAEIGLREAFQVAHLL